MRRCRTLVAGAAVVAVAALASACSDDEPTDLPTLGGSPSEESSAAEPTSDAPTAGEPAKKGDKVAGDGYEVVAGRLPAGGPEKKLAQVFVDYMTFRVASYNMASPHVALPGVATGDALTTVQGRAAELAQQGLRTVGRSVVNVDEVTIDGDTAVLSGCLGNGTVDVDDKLRAVESPAPAYDVEVDAVQAAPGTWLISAVAFADADGC